MDIEKLTKLVNEGKTYPELAKELGYGRPYLNQVCKKLGLKPKMAIAQTNNVETAERVRELVEKGLTNTEISKELGISTGAVRRCTTKVLGLETNSVKAKKIKDVNLTDEQLEIIYGGLLGDMCVSKTQKLARLTLSQGGGHEEYFDHLCSKFPGLLGRVNKTPRFDNRTKLFYNKFAVKFLAHETYLKIHNLCYPNGIKTVSKEWTDKLTARSIAYWFMDDGAKNGIFATNGFTKEDVELLQEMMLEKFNIRTCVKKVTLKDPAKDQYLLIVFKDDLYFFEKLIEPYVVKSMRYKFVYFD